MPSPSTSAGPKVKKPASHGSSSKKSNSGSNKHKAAVAAANAAFQKGGSLPFKQTESDVSNHTEGRRRLKGAFLIAIEKIEPDPNQPRKQIDPEHLDELTKSVKQLGILQPISVQFIESQDRYQIISGECRYTAAKAAGLKEIPCWIKTPKAEEVLLEQIVENWQRSDLNPFELADSLAILRDSNGYSQSELVKHTGKSKGEISKLLTILDLDSEVQSIARQDTSGRISRRHLYSIARVEAPQQMSLLKRIQKDQLTTIETEKLVSRAMQKNDKPKKAGAPVTRRKFDTKTGSVVFTYRKRQVSDTDLLMTLREVKKQIIEGSSDPAAFH